MDVERNARRSGKLVTVGLVIFSVLTLLYAVAFMLYSIIVNDPVGEVCILCSIIVVASQAGQMWEKHSQLVH